MFSGGLLKTVDNDDVCILVDKKQVSIEKNISK